jgi:hypothetical protein
VILRTHEEEEEEEEEEVSKGVKHMLQITSTDAGIQMDRRRSHRPKV